jgi:hypothetical protein
MKHKFVIAVRHIADLIRHYEAGRNGPIPSTPPELEDDVEKRLREAGPSFYGEGPVI